MKKTALSVALFAAMSFHVQSANQINTFKLQDVQLLPGAFKDAETTDLNYIMSLDPDRLLAPFLREAGLQPKAQSYTNWENTGLDGHIGGHYLTALSLMYASTGDAKVRDRLNYMLDELKRCQDSNGDGYIGGVPGSKKLWQDVANGKINTGSFDINQKWVPLYNIHKTYTGLRDAWLYTGSVKAKEMLVRYCDWMLQETSKLSDEQIQTLLRSEHGGLNEVFADVAAITGNKKYLTLAYKFSHKTILVPLEQQQDKLNGMHANTQIPKVIGFERIAEIAEDTAYRKAARFFWETVIDHRTCAIGGNSVREHFHPSNNFSSMITSEQGPETCNTYNMLKLTKMLYQAEGLEKYMDYYERALYNHILSTQHPGKGGFVYFTPMRPGHYRVYSQPQTSMWCCVGSGMENHAKYNEMIYAYDQKDLFVNLFIPSRLNWKEKGIVLTQNTAFPESETTTLTVEAKKASGFTLQVRYPVWVAPKALKIQVNGEPVEIKANPGSYVAIQRKWKSGDKITISLPMQTTVEQMPDGSDYVAILHGPIVLAAKTDTSEMTGLFADDSRGGHIASGRQIPLLEMPMFASKDKNIASMIKPVTGKSLTFTAGDLIYQDKYKNLELVPFYKLHDSRYMIYWQIETPEKILAIQQKLAEEEAVRQKLEAMTLDQVVCGEQQPESDHFIETDRSNVGVNKDRHWRDARGWFSYKLRDKDKQSDKLQVTYFGGDKGRTFKILINNQPIADVILDSNHGNDFYTMDYAIPANLIKQSTGTLVVKFEAATGSVAGGIYEVRLLKK